MNLMDSPNMSQNEQSKHYVFDIHSNSISFANYLLTNKRHIPVDILSGFFLEREEKLQ